MVYIPKLAFMQCYYDANPIPRNSIPWITLDILTWKLQHWSVDLIETLDILPQRWNRYHYLGKSTKIPVAILPCPINRSRCEFSITIPTELYHCMTRKCLCDGWITLFCLRCVTIPISNISPSRSFPWFHELVMSWTYISHYWHIVSIG